MKKWSLYMQLPTGAWTRISANAYDKERAEKVWEDALLDQIRTRGPARELRPVEEPMIDGADTAKTPSRNLVGFLLSEDRPETQ